MKTKLTKILSLVLAVSVIAVCFASCAKGGENVSSTPVSSEVIEKTDINVAILKGPTALGMLKLMDDNASGNALNNYKFETFTAPTDVVPKIVNKSIDIAAVPTNVAATLYKRTEKNVSIIAVNTLGVLSIVTNGVEINSVADLKNKTIYATGQGATNEYALNFILEKNGLKVGTDVKVEYLAEHSELATKVIAGNVQIAMLPQPFVTNVTLKNQNVKIALDLTEQWEKIPDNDSQLVMGCIVVRNDFLNENKAAVNNFLSEYSASTLYANEKVAETAALSEKHDILPAAVVNKALPKCNIVYLAGKDMKKSVSKYLEVLFAANPKSIGGEIPDDNFYYEK